MSKAKVSLWHKVGHWFTYHTWLKAVSLLLAILLWLYVRDQLNKYNF